MSARFLPASEASQPQLANCTFFGSPPPRSSRMSRVVSALIFVALPGLQPLQQCSRPPSCAQAGSSAAGDAGARSGIGILIDRGIDAARPCLVDRAQRLELLPQFVLPMTL